MNTPKTGARRRAIVGHGLAVLIGATALTGCVQIETPDKPIEINLTINILQELVYRMDGEAKKPIDKNSEIF